ncbi:MAG: site-specific integrase [Chloroflexota bacterium]|nr:site-specific integrase [Chloroflexota bacterium]
MTVSHRRSNGEGSLYRTASGRWRGAVLVTNPLTGGLARRYASGRTRAEAAAHLEALRRDAQAGAFVSDETIGEYLARWLPGARSRLRPSTYTEAVRHVEQYFGPLIGAIPLTRLTPTDVDRAMGTLQGGGYSAQTVIHARATLRRALHDAQRDGLLIRNSAALARPPRAARREMRPLTATELRALLEATADEPMGPLFAVAAGTGLRLGELLGLRWSDVTDGSLTVRRSYARAEGGGWAMAEPKTRRSRRTVMLPAVAREGLKRQQQRQAAARDAAGTAWQDDLHGQVFTDAVGRPLHPTAVSHAFRFAADRLRLPVRLHDLRHTAATLLLGAGVPLKIVSETLGHSSIAVTADAYAHVTPELRREAATAMDRALG